MKKMVLILLLACVIAQPVSAADNGFCEMMVPAAEYAMMMRQMNAPISVTVQAMRDVTVGFEALFKPMKEMVEYAYQEPVRSTKAGRLQAVQIFKQQNAEWCKQVAGSN